MPSYPTTTAAAQQIAGEIARSFVNLECVECGKAIVCALGPRADATVIKLRVAAGKGRAIILSSQDLQVSLSGQHIGIRVGESVYDNHHPDGVPAALWPWLYTDGEDGPLLVHERPIGQFFGRAFRWRE